jgi:hypothetical protein
MHGTNVELSKKEMELVTSSEFILTKNRIIGKVYSMFGLLSEDYKNILQAYTTKLPVEVFRSSPKIYKGENYLSLPYAMMDYPRVFLKDDVFAIRNYFWWGNYFSITLQLSGKFLQQFSNNIELNLIEKRFENYFVCINNSPWEHHFEASNYKPLKTRNSTEILNKPFFKIAAKLSLNEWNNAEVFFRNNYSNFIKLIIE